MIPPMIPATLAAVPVTAITGHRVAVLESLRGRVEGGDRGGDRHERPRGQQTRDAVARRPARDRLDRDVGDAEQDPGGRAEHEPMVLRRRPDPRAHDQQRARRDQAGLERDHPGQREARVRAVRGRERQRRAASARRPSARARSTGGAPIRRPKIRSAITASRTTPPASTAWTSDSGAIDIAATWKIQAPVAITIPIANSFEANSERARPQRPAHVDGRRGAGAAVLVQKADVGRQSAGEREQDAKEKSHN